MRTTPGWYLLTMAIVCDSCSANYLSRGNHIITKDYAYFSNEEIRISIRYFGDYKFDGISRFANVRQFKKLARPYVNGNPIKYNSLVFTNRTENPYFKSGLWYLDETAINLEKIKADFYCKEQDSVFYYEKLEISIVKEGAWLLRLYPLEKKYLFFVVFTDVTHQEKPMDINVLNQLMIDEYRGIFSTMKIGDP